MSYYPKSDFDHLYTEEFKRVYAGMEVRAKFVKEHSRRMRAIERKWGEAHNPNSPTTWQQMVDILIDTIDFIKHNKKMFPNWRYHLESWELLRGIAQYHVDHKDITPTKDKPVLPEIDLPGYYEGVLHSKKVR